MSELRVFLHADLEKRGHPSKESPCELAPFESADPGDLAVLPHRASPLQIGSCRAGVVVGDAAQERIWIGTAVQAVAAGWFLRVEDPAWALWLLLDGPCRPSERPEDWLSEPETVDRFGTQARTALVHRDTQVGSDTWIGPGAVLHPRVRIGNGCRIGEGTVLGAPGFGLVERNGRQWPLPHWAGVWIEPDVWIGPQCQVSAGLLEPTFIGTGARLDAQIQVGHNARIGPGCILAAQTGLSGSVDLGAGSVVGGQVGFAEHVVLGAHCLVAARSGVTRSWPEGSKLAGFPAMPLGKWRRKVAG
ncbi:MAG TPA: UDP-3-O-(3-hydroxymyristoyl)glucosamine N-acyltransferase [Fibrobacteria bacterium]|nr:UDP-3-O-(3-hydroxymyristoyl)glucosamine N-acyltransferase [Fibrobacteria bacterium]